jgi:RimJ/RimL family protein N-acetyltransferase
MLPNEINQEIDKFAIILRGEMNSKGTPKMIGMVGTNRWSTNTPGKEMETGYCLNMAYWGKGYATEAFTCFLKYFWTISGKGARES